MIKILTFITPIVMGKHLCSLNTVDNLKVPGQRNCREVGIFSTVLGGSVRSQGQLAESVTSE
jgi:hypothetical protein